MTIAGTPRVENGCLMVRDKKVLTGVPANVVVSPAGSGLAFLGATAAVPSSRHVFTLGVLEGHRFLSLFRFKIWWMIPRVGKSGSEIPIETQMLLLEAEQESALQNRDSSESCHEQTFYILLLPILDGPFRATLQGTPADELQFCVESGDAAVQTSQFLEAVFVNSGDNPFELIKKSIKILENHKGTFCHIGNKKVLASYGTAFAFGSICDWVMFRKIYLFGWTVAAFSCIYFCIFPMHLRWRLQLCVDAWMIAFVLFGLIWIGV